MAAFLIEVIFFAKTLRNMTQIRHSFFVIISNDVSITSVKAFLPSYFNCIATLLDS